MHYTYRKLIVIYFMFPALADMIYIILLVCDNSLWLYWSPQNQAHGQLLASKEQRMMV